jgi:hypothetical protein
MQCIAASPAFINSCVYVVYKERPEKNHIRNITSFSVFRCARVAERYAVDSRSTLSWFESRPGLSYFILQDFTKTLDTQRIIIIPRNDSIGGLSIFVICTFRSKNSVFVCFPLIFQKILAEYLAQHISELQRSQEVPTNCLIPEPSRNTLVLAAGALCI